MGVWVCGHGGVVAHAAAPGQRGVLLVALVWHLALLNQAPTNVYFAQTLMQWEQGVYPFYGLGPVAGRLWPYVALLYVLVRVSRKDAHP